MIEEFPPSPKAHPVRAPRPHRRRPLSLSQATVLQLIMDCENWGRRHGLSTSGAFTTRISETIVCTTDKVVESLERHHLINKDKSGYRVLTERGRAAVRDGFYTALTGLHSTRK
jgi:hypothetical protein